jgi:hypothetical protein
MNTVRSLRCALKRKELYGTKLSEKYTRNVDTVEIFQVFFRDGINTVTTQGGYLQALLVLRKYFYVETDSNA